MTNSDPKITVGDVPEARMFWRGSVQRLGKLPKPQLAAVLVAVVVVLGVGIILGAYMIQRHNKQHLPAPIAPSIVVTTPETYPSTAAKLNAQIAAAKTPQAKAALYDKLATDAQLAGQTDAALQAATKAAQLDTTADRAAMAGALYAQINDWPDAVTWYQKAVNLTPKTTNPRVNDAYNTYLNDLNNAKSNL